MAKYKLQELTDMRNEGLRKAFADLTINGGGNGSLPFRHPWQNGL